MNLAYTMAPGRGDTDLILHKLAADLGACGLRCCGTVQINSERADSGPCDMDVQVLPDGPARTKLEYQADQPQDVAMHIRGNAAKTGAVVSRGFSDPPA